MEFIYSFGVFELALISTFLLFYIFYLIRIRSVSIAVKSSARRVIYKLVLRGLYFTLFIVALLGPSFGEMKREVKAIGKDIFICVDLSKSMDAIDIKPSRLERVKFELEQVVNAFSSDRIGLVVFTNEAFLQCPLTYDQKAQLMFLGTLSTNLITSNGTDFSYPLRMALQKHDAADQVVPTQQQSKIIILVSDGEDHGEMSSEVAKEIKDQGIKLFTLGVGTTTGGKIPEGYRFKRDREGNDVVTRLDASGLQRLASATDGKYFELSDQRNDVNRMIKAINEIEGELRNARQVDASANKYHYFLAIGMLLMFLDVLVTVKLMHI